MVDVLFLGLDLLLCHIRSSRYFHYIVETQAVLRHLADLGDLIETFEAFVLNCFLTPGRQKQFRQVHIFMFVLAHVFKSVLQFLVPFRIDEIAQVLIKLLVIELIFANSHICILFLSRPINDLGPISI